MNHHCLGVVSLWMNRGLEAAAANTRWRVQPGLAAEWSLEAFLMREASCLTSVAYVLFTGDLSFSSS